MATNRAKQLRQHSTTAERRMWRMLYPFRSDGYHFRKQAPIGPYYADIACHHAKLIIEVDGDTHGTDAGHAHDQRRDAFLGEQGYTVLRFSNLDVLSNPAGVFERIGAVLADRPKAMRGVASE